LPPDADVPRAAAPRVGRGVAIVLLVLVHLATLPSRSARELDRAAGPLPAESTHARARRAQNRGRRAPVPTPAPIGSEVVGHGRNVTATRRAEQRPLTRRQQSENS